MLKQILYTASVTPFSENGSKIDYKSLEVILKNQDNAGNGIVLLGSTGESLSLNTKEKREIVEFACNLKLKSKIVVGAPSHNFEEAKQWIENCNSLPIQGYLLTTPIYTKAGIKGQTKWFEELLNLSKHPAMLYNIPGRAAVNLYPETVKNLLGHPNFVAIKDSSGETASTIKYKAIAPNIAVYCGDDYMMPESVKHQGCGLISIASNAWATETRKYVEYCLSGKTLADDLWWQACKALFSASNPIPIKALMKELGLISQDTLRLPLTTDDLPEDSRETLLKYTQQIIKWGK